MSGPVLALVPEPEPEEPKVGDDAEAAWWTLAGCFTTGHSRTLSQLADLAALRLEGHVECGRLLHPRPGDLTVGEAYGRCRSALDAMTPTEQHAIIVLLTGEVRGKR